MLNSFDQFEWENLDDLWDVLPLVKFATTRNQAVYRNANLPVPDMEMQFAFPPPPRYKAGRRRPGEWQRKRHDSKVPFWWNRFNSLVSSTYGRLSEYGDIASAVYLNAGNPAAIAAAVAYERYIDVAYGTRSRMLKEHFYGKAWNLPFGIDVVSRLWR